MSLVVLLLLRKTRRRTKSAWLESRTQWQHSLSHIMFKTGKEMRKALHYLKATLGHKLASLLPTNLGYLMKVFILFRLQLLGDSMKTVVEFHSEAGEIQ